jgi:hypothetical protein
VARMGEMTNAYKIMDAKSEGKTPLRGPRRRWQDNKDYQVLKKNAVPWSRTATDARPVTKK